jgi:hypothetical protein
MTFSKSGNSQHELRQYVNGAKKAWKIAEIRPFVVAPLGHIAQV